MQNSLYKQHGNNEPYKELDQDTEKCWRDPQRFFQLLSGPSTNFYVGPNEIHYTIPKRLLYEYSEFAKPCLEGNFAEAGANAVWLPDVSPNVFQWIWKWLYQGRLEIAKNCGNLWEDEALYSLDTNDVMQACQLLCRVHMLGERLLMDTEFLRTVQEEIEEMIERANDMREYGYLHPFTPELLLEVLLHSTPVPEFCAYSYTSLRAFVFKHLCEYDICASFDFMKFTGCYELDGAFAARLMEYMARELVWAVELWGAQTESTVDVVGKKLELAEQEGNLQAMVNKPKRRSNLWLVLRYLCTFEGCTTTSFYKYKECFEFDGDFAANILAYMAGELRWIRESGGRRGARG